MKRIKAFAAAFVLSVTSLLGLVTPHAFAATRTWDGGGSDNNLNTAANWSGDVAPSAGDDLVFPANTPRLTITNNYTAATSFNSLTFSGTASQASNYTISGNSITLVAGISHTMTGSFARTATLDINITLNGNQTFATTSDTNIEISGDINVGGFDLTINTDSAYFTFSGDISGTSGELIKDTGDGGLILSGNNTFQAGVTINTGDLVVKSATALGTDDSGTTVADGANLYIVQASGALTIAEPLTLRGDGSSGYGVLSLVTSFNQGGGSLQPPYAVTELTGAITLAADTTVRVALRTGKITGPISGAHDITLSDTSVGTLIINSSSNGSNTPNSTLEPPVKETTYSDDQDGVSVTVNYNETAIITGVRGDVYVNPNGVLKGTGTVGTLYVAGKVAPGLSPGCLNSGDLLFIDGSTYDFEVGGTTVCDDYDQIDVTGTVTLTGSLNLILFDSFKPTAGQKYVIINNDGTDAVESTFSGLDQGETFTVGGYNFSISYTGGDGNDVEVTALGAAPDTGFALIKSNPLVSAGIMLSAALAIAWVARRSKLAAHRR